MRCDGLGLVKTTLGANAAVLTAAFALGCGQPVTIDFREAWSHPPSTRAALTAGIRDAATILFVNARALLGLLVFGVCSGGMYGWVVLAANGYALGSMSAAVAATQPAAIPLVLAYAPMEFAAMLLVATTAQALSFATVGWVWGQRIDARPAGCLLLVAAPLVVVAAALETVVIHRLQGLVR